MINGIEFNSIYKTVLQHVSKKRLLFVEYTLRAKSLKVCHRPCAVVLTSSIRQRWIDVVKK